MWILLNAVSSDLELFNDATSLYNTLKKLMETLSNN